MAEGIPNPEAGTVEEAFKDFNGRRAAILNALTRDVEEFFHDCDPDKENMCLYGLPNETWEVNLPSEELPPDLPEPALGINFARDGMLRKHWLTLVAAHSDTWLLSVAFFFGTRFGFEKKERKKLFDMINGLPTLFEIVTGVVNESKEQSATPSSSSISKSKGKSQSSEPMMKGQVNMSAPPNQYDGDDQSGDENEDDDQGAKCGACGGNNDIDQFWICCDICEVWFHGKCVNITPAMAEQIKQYKCPLCSNSKRPRV